MINFGPYAKAIQGTIGAGIAAAITALQDGNIEGWEWAGIVGAVLVAAAAIYSVENVPDGVRRYAKAITAALVAAVAVVGTALADGQGITGLEILGVALALLNGFSVATVPNAEESDNLIVHDYTGDPEHADDGAELVGG